MNEIETALSPTDVEFLLWEQAKMRRLAKRKPRKGSWASQIPSDPWGSKGEDENPPF